MRVIGFLNSGSEQAFQPHVTAFKDGLTAETGLVEGADLQIVSRWANGHYYSLRDLADDLVKRKVDIIATTGGTVSAQAAMDATTTIPILFISGYDPEKVESFTNVRGPGANATGISVQTTETVPKRLAYLRELAPNAKKIAVLLRPSTFVYEREVEEANKADLTIVTAFEQGELGDAFARARKTADALLVCADPFFTSRRELIVGLAAENNLATAYAWREFVAAGGLMSYGPVLTDAYRQIGVYAGKILNGATPRDLPIDKKKPLDFELVINGRTADALALEISPRLRAEGKVI